MQGVEKATQWGYSLYEFEVYGKALKENLQKLYDEYYMINQNLYTPNSLDLFNKILKETKDILDNHNATLEVVQATEEKLQIVYQQLVKKADKTALKEGIDTAKNINKTLYTPNSIENLERILTDIEKVYKDANATNAQVEAAIDKLNTVLNSLVKKVDKTELDNILKIAKNIQEELYTPLSVKEFKNVIQEVENHMPDDNATIEEVEEIITRVQQAYHLLISRADNTQLKKAVQRGEKINRFDYTSNSLEKLDKAIEKAKKVINNQNATDDEVNKALQEMNKAINGLVNIESRLLKDLMNQVKTMDMSFYEEKSVKELKTVLQKAEEVLISSDQEKIDKMYLELQRTIKELKKKPTNPNVPEKPQQPIITPTIPNDQINSDVLGDEINTTQRPNSQNNTKNVKTSDMTMIAPYIILTICAISMYMYLRKKEQ